MKKILTIACSMVFLLTLAPQTARAVDELEEMMLANKRASGVIPDNVPKQAASPAAAQVQYHAPDPDPANPEKINMGEVHVYNLTATIDGQQFVGPDAKAIASGDYTMTGDMVNIVVGKPLQLRLELHRPDGQVTDVSDDLHTTYHVIMGDHFSVSPTGVVTAYNDPVPGEESFGFTDEGTIMAQYEDVHGDQEVNPKGILATVSVRFKIRK